MRITYQLLVWLGLISAVARAPAQELKATPKAKFTDPVLVYVDAGVIYYLHVPKGAIIPAKHEGPLARATPVEIWKATRLKGDWKARKILWDAGWMFQPMCRWRVKQASFWASGWPDHFSRIPLPDFRLSRIEHAKGQVETWGIKPIVDILFDARFQKGHASIEDAFTDFLPQGNDGLVSFLAWKGKLRVWSGKIDADKWPNIEWVNHQDKDSAPKPVLEATTDLREPFVVYDSQAHFFFVSRSGKLHFCPRRGERLATKTAWEDTTRPISVLVNDSGSGKTFAFTRKGESGNRAKGLYFELGETVRPETYDQSTIPELSPEEPLKSIGVYVDLLVTKKKIP